jgi:hypothetical protein
MRKVKSKVNAKLHESIEESLRKTYEQEATRALNEAVACPAHGNMELEVTLSEDGELEVSGVACCAQGQAALEKAIKE